MQRITSSGCYLPRPEVVAADYADQLESVCYYLSGEGFQVEHITEAEARPVPMADNERLILATVWLAGELIEQGRAAPGSR